MRWYMESHPQWSNCSYHNLEWGQRFTCMTDMEMSGLLFSMKQHLISHQLLSEVTRILNLMMCKQVGYLLLQKFPQFSISLCRHSIRSYHTSSRRFSIFSHELNYFDRGALGKYAATHEFSLQACTHNVEDTSTVCVMLKKYFSQVVNHWHKLSLLVSIMLSWHMKECEVYAPASLAFGTDVAVWYFDLVQTHRKNHASFKQHSQPPIWRPLSFFLATLACKVYHGTAILDQSSFSDCIYCAL